MTLFAAQLRAARKAAKLTTIQLGARLGVSANVITYWEKGSRTPDADRQAVIMAALSAPPRDLVALVAELQADVTARIARFAADMETARTAPASLAPIVPALAELESLTSTPAAAESSPRVRRKRAQ